MRSRSRCGRREKAVPLSHVWSVKEGREGEMGPRPTGSAKMELPAQSIRRRRRSNYMKLTWTDLLIEDISAEDFREWIQPWAGIISGTVAPAFLNSFGVPRRDRLAHPCCGGRFDE
jgi:hypothetical protein